MIMLFNNSFKYDGIIVYMERDNQLVGLKDVFVVFKKRQFIDRYL